MRHRYLIILLLAAAPSLSRAQKSAKPFEAFSQRQNNLFIAAYKKRDTAAYNILLKEWLDRYDSLPAGEKKTFTAFYANAYYNLCCTYALLGDKTRAINCFEKAVRAGYVNYAHIMEDSDLDALRGEARFRGLAQSTRETGDYLYILQKARRYDSSDHRPLPAFTYQPADAPALVSLRKAFNLDSIAGGGNDVSKALNLLHWVHNIVRHDGNHENPAVKNAFAMITLCKKEDRGLNCRGLSTVLNECYLALGFKSRLVTCLPKDSLGVDPDCHVIDMVYIPMLKKWIWADPTHDAYVMNEKGELLGIEDVRQRLISGEPLLLNPTANWNYQTSTLKTNYLYNYMAKNLYMLQCPVSSQYNNETLAAGKTIGYVQLLPLDYFSQKPDRRETADRQHGTTKVFFNTNNPQAFWQIP